MATLLNRLLAHPLTRGRSVDDPHTTLLRRQIILQKPFLTSIYKEWYQRLLASFPAEGSVLEIGSGAGFFGEMSSRVVTSEVFDIPGIDVIVDGRNIPFDDGELAGIAMTDVLHHMPDVSQFFLEAARCVRQNGRMVMIEPWRTPWSEMIYRSLHSEPFEPEADWTIPYSGPLSGANGALPWIVFERDRLHFLKKFPQWRLKTIEPMMPFSYLLSGGVSLRALLPGCCYSFIRKAEKFFNQKRWAMFAFIELDRL